MEAQLKINLATLLQQQYNITDPALLDSLVKQALTMHKIDLTTLLTNGETVLIVKDLRERSHGVFGQTKEIKDTTILSKIGKFAEDQRYGKGWFISKKQLENLEKSFQSLNVKYKLISA